MVGFSEYLQNFMKTNSISMVELSKETDIDRTVIYRYVKGTRVPSDMDIVVRIADAMQMSVSEKKHLLEEYDKLVLGEPMVYSYRYIQNLIRSLGELNKLDSTGNNQWRTICEFKMDTPIIELATKEEIATYVLDLFQYLVEKNCCEKIFMIMQPIYDEIQKFIPQIFRQSDIQIEQIVCMEQNISQGYKNLKVFQGILPILFSLSNYDVYYYYDSLSNHINTMTSMPNIIIVQDYVVQFDYNMERGIVVKSDIYAETMRKQYNTLRKEVRSLLIRGNKPEIMSEFIPKMGMMKGGCLFEQLCMGACLDREILERCIYPIDGREEFIETLLDTRGEWHGQKYIEGEVTLEDMFSYGKRKGLEEFMRTGIIKEFPQDLYAPLSMEERKRVLSRMILMIQEERIHYRFVSDKVELPDGIHIYWSEETKRFALNRIRSSNMLQIIIDEQSIYRTFQMYLEYLERKSMIYTEEETLKSMLKMQKKFGGGNTCLGIMDFVANKG